MKTSLILCCCLFLFSAVNAQSSNLPPNAEPGKCYTKMLIPTSLEPEWREVLCQGKLNKKIIRSMESQLNLKGFYDFEIKGKITKELNQSITDYQRSNNLPVGGLDFETLAHLGVVGF